MDPDFWQQKWQSNAIGFHQNRPNPLLEEHFERLALSQNSRVFLPLCGKTLDIAWLLRHSYQVAGAELVESAVVQLFEELEVTPDVVPVGDVTHYSAENIDIFVGDIFALSSAVLGQVDAIYDRAALVALPETMRTDYSAHMMQLTGSASQLLITYVYDQTIASGPPFSIEPEEVNYHYSQTYNVTLEARRDVPGGLQGKYPAEEHVWLLHRR